MAYETGVASTPADLLSKFLTFAVTNGWTSTACTSGYALSKGQVVVGVASDSDEIFGRGATAVNAGAAWNAQTNNSGWTHSANLGVGPFTAYHFYSLTESGKELLAAVVEISSGVFRHFLICDLIKYGTWTGGPYTNSTYHNTGTPDRQNYPWASYHRYINDASQGNSPAGGAFWCDVDGLTNNWILEWVYNDYTASTRGPGIQRGNGIENWFMDAGWQRWNLRTPLMPAEVWVNRPSSLRSLAGRIPAFRHCNIRNHTPGEIITIGGSDFQLWPIVSRTDSWNNYGSTVPSSGYMGYAYKRT
jgi:hypothetical protein